ncbi:hypothetical protein MRX96_030877 [Rhipicephalus microplus]
MRIFKTLLTLAMVVTALSLPTLPAPLKPEGSPDQPVQPVVHTMTDLLFKLRTTSTLTTHSGKDAVVQLKKAVKLHNDERPSLEKDETKSDTKDTVSQEKPHGGPDVETRQ